MTTDEQNLQHRFVTNRCDCCLAAPAQGRNGRISRRACCYSDRESAGTNDRACADLLEAHTRQLHLDCERFQTAETSKETDQEHPCLLTTFGSGERSLYFHGHYDVVPAQSSQQFQPTRKDNFIFGRGSCDMKGGIVAMLYAILAIKEHARNLNGKVSLTLVPDEETGGKHGSAWLASEGLLGRNGIGMLLAEPTGGVVWNANRGAISLRVRIFGKSAACWLAASRSKRI